MTSRYLPFSSEIDVCYCGGGLYDIFCMIFGVVCYYVGGSKFYFLCYSGGGFVSPFFMPCSRGGVDDIVNEL